MLSGYWYRISPLASLILYEHSLFCIILLWSSGLEGFVERTVFHNRYHFCNYYYYVLTLMDHLSFLLTCAWNLLVWLGALKVSKSNYFGNHQFITEKARALILFNDKYSVTWSLVSLLVASTLYLLKGRVLSRWHATFIYKRFRSRILMAGFQLYFLSLIINGSRFQRLKPICRRHNSDAEGNIARFFETSPILLMLSQQSCLIRVIHIARFLKQASLSDQFDLKGQVSKKCNQITGTEEYVTEQALQRMGVESAQDAKLLLQQLQAELGTTDVTYEAFQKWLIDAHEDCLSLGCTLVNAFKVAGILSDVLTYILYPVAAIFWICVATPVGSYVRGATVQNQLIVIAVIFTLIGWIGTSLIPGPYFLFVVHPFSIGDRCKIGGEEVEITKMDTFQTTCKNIDTGEEMRYLNSDLQTKLNFTVLEGEPKLTDEIELVLDPSNSADILSHLTKEIEDFFGEDARVFEKSSKVQTTEIGSKIKMRVRFDHAMNLREYLNPFKSFLRKNTQRSELLMEIMRLLDKLNIKVAAP